MKNIIEIIKPEYFDILGVVTFIFILFIGVWGLINKKKLPKWVNIIFIIIGLLGLLIDIFIVSNTLLK